MKGKQAANRYAIALFDLAKEYNRFYADLPIFLEDDAIVLAFRVALSMQTAKTIKRGMSLLGIAVPDRM
jgi:arginyl-tRNA synthetase